MKLKILDWKVTVGLSIVALLFNLAYFLIIDHSILEAIKMSATSLFSIGTTHGAHSYHNKKNKFI